MVAGVSCRRGVITRQLERSTWMARACNWVILSGYEEDGASTSKRCQECFQPPVPKALPTQSANSLSSAICRPSPATLVATGGTIRTSNRGEDFPPGVPYDPASKQSASPAGGVYLRVVHHFRPCRQPGTDCSPERP